MCVTHKAPSEGAGHGRFHVTGYAQAGGQTAPAQA
jgi:hypothetical protein